MFNYGRFSYYFKIFITILYPIVGVLVIVMPEVMLPEMFTDPDNDINLPLIMGISSFLGSKIIL